MADSSRAFRTILLALALGIATVVLTRAQPPQEAAFEVTSVKANKSGAAGAGAPGDRFSSGLFRTTNMPLRLLMRQAFQKLQDSEIVGGPAWMDSDRWDITGKAASPTAAMLPMIRTLLADRFRLVVHHENRELPIYALVIARRDGRLGPSLRPSTGKSDFRDATGLFVAHAIPLKILVDVLAYPARRTVVDRTGLSGTYDIELRYTSPVMADAGLPSVPDAPSVFTAVQEQLGLKLEATRGPVDVIVIDHVEKPVED